MIASNSRVVPLATDFDAWYAGRKPTKVVARDPDSISEATETERVDTTGSSITDHNSGNAGELVSTDSSTRPASQPATAFTLFPDLPFELRAKIWKAVLPGPRVILPQYWHLAMPIMDVCQESRAYYRALRTDCGAHAWSACINTNIDTLYIDNLESWEDMVSGNMNPAVVDNLRHIAFESSLATQVLTDNPKYLLNLKRLETLTIVPFTECLFPNFNLLPMFTKPCSQWPQSLTKDDLRELATPWFSGNVGYMEWYREQWRNVMQAMSTNLDLDSNWKIPRVEIKGLYMKR